MIGIIIGLGKYSTILSTEVDGRVYGTVRVGGLVFRKLAKTEISIMAILPS